MKVKLLVVNTRIPEDTRYVGLYVLGIRLSGICIRDLVFVVVSEDTSKKMTISISDTTIISSIVEEIACRMKDISELWSIGENNE